jgi:hypothetical protein
VWVPFHDPPRIGDLYPVERTEGIVPAKSFGWPSTVKASINCLPILMVGFSEVPGSWYTIDACVARNRRSCSRFKPVMSVPSTAMWPWVIRPLRGK